MIDWKIISDQAKQKILKFNNHQIELKNQLLVCCNPDLPDQEIKPKINLDNLKQNKKDIIWQYWDKGWENAPPIIQLCSKSVTKYLSTDYIIIRLSDSNLDQYLDINKNMLHVKQNYSTTHFSDILRIELLATYGGFWIDATILFTSQDIPFMNTDQDFVCYKYRNSRHLLVNYFIYSKPNSYILTNLRRVLYQQIIIYGTLMDYHQFCLLLFCLYCSDSKFQENWDKLPGFYCEINHKLQARFELKFDHNIFQELLNKSSLHKLTQKYKRILPNSTLEYLLNKFDK